MKKLLSVIMVVAMILSLSITAFADEIDSISETSSQEITGTAQFTKDLSLSEVTYSVTVSWTLFSADEDFYNFEAYAWNPVTLMYTKDTAKSTTIVADNFQSDLTGSVKITNKSNAAVKYELSYSDDGAAATKTKGFEFEDVTTNKTGTVASADTAVGSQKYTENAGPALSGDIVSLTDLTKLETKGTEQSADINVELMVRTNSPVNVSDGDTLNFGSYTITLSNP